MPEQTLNTSTSTTLAAHTPVAMTCVYVVGARYRDLYDLYDDQSLDAFHGWLGKRIADELGKKYGRRSLDLIPQHEIWQDDLGLIADCDFQEREDGSLLVTFSREPYPQWGILRDDDLTTHADGWLEVNFRQALMREACENEF